MRRISLIMAVVFLFGCTTVKSTEEPAARAKNPRIKYRDLTVPAKHKVPPLPSEMKENASRRDSAAGVEPLCFVEFANDSYSTYDKDSLAGIENQLTNKKSYLIVGHSHGQSAVGTLRLASKRAETIARELKGRGLENVYVMAAWGSATIDFAPNRGVHIYGFRSAGDKKGLPIIFAKEINASKDKLDKPCKVAGSKKGDREMKI